MLWIILVSLKFIFIHYVLSFTFSVRPPPSPPLQLSTHPCFPFLFTNEALWLSGHGCGFPTGEPKCSTQSFSVFLWAPLFITAFLGTWCWGQNHLLLIGFSFRRHWDFSFPYFTKRISTYFHPKCVDILSFVISCLFFSVLAGLLYFLQGWQDLVREQR